MLPTKGYFQDIECPFNKSSCGRPYCHFRHKRKANECSEEIESETKKDAIPTYKPTPKSELANIHNNKSHIPISYVPDLAFKRKTPVRPLPKFKKPTYNPTPLSILSSASKVDNIETEETTENSDVIKDIQQIIANKEYDPLKSEINFNDLTPEFELLDSIIQENESEPEEKVNTDLIKIENDIEEQQNRLNLLQTELINTKINEKDEYVLPTIKIEKDDSDCDKKPQKVEEKKTVSVKKSKDRKLSNSSDCPSKSKHTDSSKKGSKNHKSKEREKHRKEQKKHSSPERSSHKKQKKSKESSPNRKRKKSNDSSSEISSNESSLVKSKKQTKKSRSRSRSKDKHKKSSKSKRKSRSRSREKKSKEKSDKSRSKDQKSKSRSREKEYSKSKSKEKENRHKSTGKKEKEKEKQSSESSANLNDNDDSCLPEDTIGQDFMSDSDLDLDDEDETMRECFKIFSEYKPEPKKPPECSPPTEQPDCAINEDSVTYQAKKRTAHAGADNSVQIKPTIKPKSMPTPGQTLTNRYKEIKLNQKNNEQENIMAEVRNITTQRRPPISLLEAAKLHKIRKMEQLKMKSQKPSTNIVDDILKGVHKPSPSQVKKPPKRIAAVPNVALIQKAKERISIIKQTIQTPKTVAQIQKGGRVAHTPEFSLSDIPDVLQADKSKLPVNVRTRFLTMIAEECGKLYAARADAYTRALNEEFSCYEKCKVLATYRNSAMLAVNRLRKEIQDRENRGLGLLLSGETSTTEKDSDFKGSTFYNHVKKWMLNEDELDVHGYPKESSVKGKAIIKNRKPINFSAIDENYRKCARCPKTYQVDDDGWALFEEECLYHPLKKRTIKGEQIYLCCKSNDETGCATSDTHVFDGLEKHLLEGFQTTMPPREDNDPRSVAVYALDCEMCYTTKGLELTRVTIVDIDCKTVYESLVKPLNPIIDYNTRFSGITKDQMDKTSTSILQIQANILHLCNSDTILVGHSLESDMKALKIIHGSIIDTSVLFPHKMGLPHKRALRALASEHLKKIIQNDVSGHDSAEDAITCMELIKWKLKEDLKVRTK